MLTSAPAPAAMYVLDVRTRVAEKDYAAACQAVGTFGALLAPLVTLQPAWT